MTTPNIELFTAGTPNGWKPSIALEELGIPYTVKTLSLMKNEPKEEWFLKINPNGRIPAIVDHSRNDFAVFESGAILLYLVQHYDKEHKLWPADVDQQSEVVQWLMFQMGGIGPMQGQANHFVRYAPEKIEYAANRYVNETKRLYSVLEARLKDREYLVGKTVSIADVATIGWVICGKAIGIDLPKEFPHTQAWVDRLLARPAFIKGLNVPDVNRVLNPDPAEEEKRMKELKEWFAKGQK